MFELWKENHVLRAIFVLILFALVAYITFVWDPFSSMGGMQVFARWGTIIGTAVSCLALFLNPILEDYAP